MRSTPEGLFGTSFALVLAMAATVQAGPINWYSSWSSSPSEIDIGSPVTNKIFLASDPTPVYHTPPSFVAATNVTTYSTAPGTVTQANGSFQLKLTLYDGYVGTTPTSAQVAVLPNYTFTFNGFFSGPATGPSLSPTQNLLGLTWLPTPGLQTATAGIAETRKIGNDFYTVSFAGYAQSDDGYAHTAGGISFLIESGGGSGASIDTVAEPGTLLLSGIGLSLCALSCWCGRKVLLRSPAFSANPS